ncbi:YihD family protein [Neiella marina]|uniref:YihD family protein n=1 Tax=Neiella holothuriorum TaxID=2870530 RepID=A0ABS7EC37_9GAMM|nr:YihD family protein [Neiella holothuriorum]MBW8189898.1 YihD family protein [Neiella holothuriorum]
MTQHKIEEFLDLLRDHWLKNQDQNLTQLLQKLADAAGCEQPLADIADDTLFYQLKMGETEKSEMIPGIAKDCEEDFKTALLKARGVIE